MGERVGRNQWLVIGASGLVGSALLRVLGPSAVGTYRTREVHGLRRLDARDATAMRALLSEVSPEVVFFPAADPNVDWCESHPDEAREANVTPALIALDASTREGCRFVFFSSDYVFDGRSGPYDEAAAVAPLNVYGHHKREVEMRVLDAEGTVVRTCSVFGAELPPPKNFVLRSLARLRAGRDVHVPVDQYSTPTWSEELSRVSIALAARPGPWHVAGPDLLTRHELAVLIAEVFGLDAALVRGVRTAELGQLAERPARGGLRTGRLQRELGMVLLPVRHSLVALREQGL